MKQPIRQDFNWTEENVLGLAILIKGGSIDSFGEKIDGNIFYAIGKHKKTGQVAIFPTGRNQKHEFMNDVMKKLVKLTEMKQPKGRAVKKELIK